MIGQMLRHFHRDRQVETLVHRDTPPQIGWMEVSLRDHQHVAVDIIAVEAYDVGNAQVHGCLPPRPQPAPHIHNALRLVVPEQDWEDGPSRSQAARYVLLKESAVVNCFTHDSQPGAAHSIVVHRPHRKECRCYRVAHVPCYIVLRGAVVWRRRIVQCETRLERGWFPMQDETENGVGRQAICGRMHGYMQNAEAPAVWKAGVCHGGGERTLWRSRGASAHMKRSAS